MAFWPPVETKTECSMLKSEGTSAVENVGKIGDPVAQLRMGVARVFPVHATRGFGF